MAVEFAGNQGYNLIRNWNIISDETRGCCKTTPKYSKNFPDAKSHFSCCRVKDATHLVKNKRNKTFIRSRRGYILFETDFRTGPERKAEG